MTNCACALSEGGEMNDQLIEILSWRIVSKLCRCYPQKLTVIETHPGGGQYDCLTIVSDKGQHIADFNRKGSFHVFNSLDGRPVKNHSMDIWREMIHSEDNKAVLDRICKNVGLPIPKKLPPSTPKSIVYRFISDFLSHSIFGLRRWECINGFCDTSGDEYFVIDDFEKFHSSAKERLRVRLPNDFLKNPAYRFWFLLENGKPLICLETTGLVWVKRRKHHNLMDLYRKKRRIWPMIMEVAGNILP